MTNQDAIKTIHELLRETNDSWYQEVYNMAISALKAQDIHDANVGDTISRQAAIDASDKEATALIEEINNILKRMCTAESIWRLNEIQNLANKRIFELWTIRCEELKGMKNERPENNRENHRIPKADL